VQLSRLARESSPGGQRLKRVLVVDDNRDAAQMLCEIIRVYGCIARAAYDGPDALEAAQSFIPDLALVDIGLPRMDGYELARRIRRLPGLGEIKLVAITGYSEPAERQRSERAGFDRHLVKPVDLKELRGLIDS
jgi:CheY-like chemotaxis protein